MESLGFIRYVEYMVSLNSKYRVLICTITLILQVYINMQATCHLRTTQALAWACMALSRGLACHVAPTYVPRKNKPLFPLFNCFNTLKIKNKFRKILEKSLKIRKFITFKIQLQINPDFFHWL